MWAEARYLAGQRSQAAGRSGGLGGRAVAVQDAAAAWAGGGDGPVGVQHDVPGSEPRGAGEQVGGGGQHDPPGGPTRPRPPGDRGVPGTAVLAATAVLAEDAPAPQECSGKPVQQPPGQRGRSPPPRSWRHGRRQARPPPRPTQRRRPRRRAGRAAGTGPCARRAGCSARPGQGGTARPAAAGRLLPGRRGGAAPQSACPRGRPSCPAPPAPPTGQQRSRGSDRPRCGPRPGGDAKMEVTVIEPVIVAGARIVGPAALVHLPGQPR